MIDWAQILVIILSIVLIVFLAAGITLVVMIIGITQKIKRITDGAQRTIEQFEEALKDVSHAAGPMFLVKMVINKIKSSVKKG